MKSLLIALAVVFAAVASEARAQHGHVGHGHDFGGHGLFNGGVIGGSFIGGGFYGGGLYGGLQGNNAIPPVNLTDRVPHFALYPPVYYSYPVPRPYGYSPFAYPGSVATPHIAPAEPQMIVNPFVIENAPSAAAPNAAPQRPMPKSETVPSKEPPSALKSIGNKTVRATAPMRVVNPFFGDAVAGTRD